MKGDIPIIVFLFKSWTFQMDIDYEVNIDKPNVENGEWFIAPSDDGQSFIIVRVKLPPVYSVSVGGTSLLPDDDPWAAPSGGTIADGIDVPVKGSNSISEAMDLDKTVDAVWFQPTDSVLELF